jgi:hypothetical protein
MLSHAESRASCYAEPCREPRQLMCYATLETEPAAMPGRTAIRTSFDAEPCCAEPAVMLTGP